MGNVLDLDVHADHVFVVFGILIFIAYGGVSGWLGVTKAGSNYLSLSRLRPLRFIGAISYTLYLLHQLVHLCFVHFFQTTWTMSIAALGCAVGLSWLSWLYVDCPTLEGSPKTGNKS